MCRAVKATEADPFSYDPLAGSIEDGDVCPGDPRRRRVRDMLRACLDAVERRDDELARSIVHGLAEQIEREEMREEFRRSA